MGISSIYQNYPNGIKITFDFLQKVGIVVPTLGTRIEYLIESLTSIKRAGCKNVILVAPKSFLEQNHEISELISIFLNDPGTGLPEAINAGVAAFPEHVKYVAWLGDDDRISENSLMNALEILERNPCVMATFGACSYIDKDGNELFVNKSGKWVVKFMHFLPNIIPQPGSVFRREAFEKVGGVKSTFPLSFDFELFFNLKQLGKLHYVPEIQGAFRWHLDSLSVNQRRSAVLQSSQIRRIFLPKPLKLWSLIWEPVIIIGTLFMGSILRMKIRIDQ